MIQALLFILAFRAFSIKRSEGMPVRGKMLKKEQAGGTL
jgi:hypothetical protein